jgi:hypothetical protein
MTFPPLERSFVKARPVIDDNPCIKCGCRCPQLTWRCAVDADGPYDWLDVTCWKCGYSWTARPRDAAPPLNAKERESVTLLWEAEQHIRSHIG